MRTLAPPPLPPEARPRRAAPLAEGPRGKRPMGFYKAQDDERLLGYAASHIRSCGFSSRSEFKKRDSGLYRELSGRGLLGRLEFEGGERKWAYMSDQDVLSIAGPLIMGEGITTRSGLQDRDSQLYKVMLERGLLERAGLHAKKQDRDWRSMSDRDVLADCQRFVDENGTKNKKELLESDVGRHRILYQRGLLGGIRFPAARRRWSAMSDDMVRSHAQKLIDEKGLCGRSVIDKEDPSLYRALRNRGLMDALRFAGEERLPRSLGAETGEKLAERFIEDDRQATRNEEGMMAKAFYRAWLPVVEGVARRIRAPATHEEKVCFGISGLFSAASTAGSARRLGEIAEGEIAKAIKENAKAEKRGWVPSYMTAERMERRTARRSDDAIEARLIAGRAVGRLDCERRKMIQMLYWDGMTFEEAAGKLRMSPAELKRKHAETLMELKEALGVVAPP